MNMPMASLADTLADAPAYTGPRRLDDDVFQTAQEAVQVEGQGNAVAPQPPGFISAGVPDGKRRGLPFTDFTHAVRAHVAARPGQSALLAAAAGALAMLVLRSRLRGRLPPLRASRLR